MSSGPADALCANGILCQRGWLGGRLSSLRRLIFFGGFIISPSPSVLVGCDALQDALANEAHARSLPHPSKLSLQTLYKTIASFYFTQSIVSRSSRECSRLPFPQ